MVLSHIWQPRCHRFLFNISFLLERKTPSCFEFIKPRAGSFKCLCIRHSIQFIHKLFHSYTTPQPRNWEASSSLCSYSPNQFFLLSKKHSFLLLIMTLTVFSCSAPVRLDLQCFSFFQPSPKRVLAASMYSHLHLSIRC